MFPHSEAMPARLAVAFSQDPASMPSTTEMPVLSVACGSTQAEARTTASTPRIRDASLRCTAITSSLKPQPVPALLAASSRRSATRTGPGLLTLYITPCFGADPPRGRRFFEQPFDGGAH